MQRAGQEKVAIIIITPPLKEVYSPRPFQTLFSSSFLLMNNDVMVSCCSCCSCHATLVSTSLTRWQSGVSPLLFDDQKEEENLRHWNSRWKEKEKENVRKLHGKLRKRKMTLVQ
jgi:hypothetical protein